MDALAEAIKKQRPIDPEQFTVFRVCESAALLKNGKGEVGILPFTESRGAYAFGQFRYPPVPDDDPVWQTVKETSAPATPAPDAEQFTAKESQRVEFTLAEDDTHRSDPANGDYPVVIIQEGENRTKHRRYTKKAVCEADVTRYIGLPMHLDHAGAEGETPVRSVRDLAGVVKNAWHGLSEGGQAQIRGTVHVFDSWLRDRLQDGDFRKLVGISHVADVAGKVESIAGKMGRCIEAITQPYAVDWVSKAAFGGRVAESEQDPINNRVEDLMALESLTLSDLKRDRPDLVEAIGVEFKTQVAESEQNDETAAKLKAAEDARSKAEAELRRVKITGAVVAEAAKPDHKITDTVRPMVVERVTARLGSQEIPDDKLSATVAEAVKAEVAYGTGFGVTAKPAIPAGAGSEAPTTPSPREKLQSMSDKLFGV